MRLQACCNALFVGVTVTCLLGDRQQVGSFYSIGAIQNGNIIAPSRHLRPRGHRVAQRDDLERLSRLGSLAGLRQVLGPVEVSGS